MSEPTGFTDLRIGYGAQGVGDDSVWPSFTDVMTVIVMIFLMALVVIMVRNYELDRRLISTISDREHAAMLNEDLQAQKLQLESTLNETLGERDTLRTELDEETVKTEALSEEQQRLQQALKDELTRIAALTLDQDKLEQELASLLNLRQQLEAVNTQLTEEKSVAEQEVARLAENEIQALAKIENLTENELNLNQRINDLVEKLSRLELESSQQISSLAEEKQTLGEKLDTVSIQLGEVKRLFAETQLLNRDLSAEVSALTQEQIDQEAQYQIATEEIEALRELILVREAENLALKAQADSSSQQYRSLQEEFDALDEEYRKLIRPARSEAGKQVAQIRFDKTSTGFVYRLREPGQAEAVLVTRDQLHEALVRLKAQFGKNLYTKIIIREDSSLSHNEAWQFTQEILNKYDYYYQP